MKLFLMIILITVSLLFCSSCLMDNAGNGENYLVGKITDTSGNDISGAEVHIIFECEADSLSYNFTRLINNESKSSGSITITISSDYLGLVRTIHHDYASGSSSLIWDGADENGNLVCNGLYKVKLTEMDEAGSVTNQDTLNILLNNLTQTNEPAVISTASGYWIPLQKYFQMGSILNIYNEEGDLIGIHTLDGDFTMIIKKDGYATLTREVSFRDYNSDHKEDFILQTAK